LYCLAYSRLPAYPDFSSQAAGDGALDSGHSGRADILVYKSKMFTKNCVVNGCFSPMTCFALSPFEVRIVAACSRSFQGFRDGASATAAGCALFVALWAWIAGSDPSTVAARAVATLIVAALAARLRAAPPTASVEACFYAVHESPGGVECASPLVYRRAARLAADARAASGPRGVQQGLIVSPRRRGDSEDHAYQDSPEHLTTATTRDGLTLL